MIKVSIIVPAYNVEKYIEKCLNSAISQTLKDIEIICINDGSTDNTLQIINKTADYDDRIYVINKPNSGYGHSMNLGIEHARGKYVVFLESDDFIAADMCEKMYQTCEKYQLEILKSDFYEFIEDNNIIYKKYHMVSEYNNYNTVLDPHTNTELFFASMYTWTCMYNREYINKHNIRHNETAGASYQDNGFWFQSLMYCKRLYLINEAFYMYRQDNPNSSINSK